MANGVNPNVEVGAEPTITSSGGNVTFSEIEAVTEKPEPKAKAEPKQTDKAPKKEAKAEPKEKAEAPKAKAKEPEADDDADEAEDSDEELPKAASSEDSPKPRTIKAKHGDKIVDLSSDMTFKVPVGGKKEDVPLETLISEFSGKQNWDRKNSELDKKAKTFNQERDQLNDFVNKLFEKSKENSGNAIIDFLAEMTGKDPVELKSQTIRAQFAALVPLFQMSDDEREQAFKDMERDWRDEKHKRREDSEKEKTAREESQKAVSTAKEKYSIPDDEYSDTYEKAKAYLKRDPELAEVIEGHRILTFRSVVDEHYPHLLEHEQFDEILSDIVSYAVRHPKYSKEDMAADLAVFGEDKGRLKNIARKAEKSAQVEHVKRPAPKSESSDSVLFSEIS